MECRSAGRTGFAKQVRNMTSIPDREWNYGRSAIRRSFSGPCGSCAPVAAFTLVELMITVALVSMATLVAYITFSTIIGTWRRGMAVTEALHHGDFVLDQLAMGLRSTYFPDISGGSGEYGFRHIDNGSGDSARDSICWVKQGLALTAPEAEEASGLHRVSFTVEENEDGSPGAAVRVWYLPYALPEDFDENIVEPYFISGMVSAFDCRLATNIFDGEWEWEESWDEDTTNVLPFAVELTLYMNPAVDGGEPVVMRRCIEIPVAHLAWQGTAMGPQR
jgi:prepilin-type N-terminal cleavage/methylation domain-containing protein